MTQEDVKTIAQITFFAGCLCIIAALIIRTILSSMRDRAYTKSIDQHKAKEAAYIAAQPPYKPKGGKLRLGTKLQIDWENPINHGKSAMVNEFWVSDILYSVAKSQNLYLLSYSTIEVTDSNTTPPTWSNVVRTNDKPQSAEEIFRWLKIVEEPEEPCQCGSQTK